MSKMKSYIFDLFDDNQLTVSNSTRIQDAEFWTTDRDAYLSFGISRQGFVIDKAIINLYNKSDKTLLIDEPLTVLNNEARFKMPSDVMSHFGRWSAQVIFNDMYTSPAVDFDILRALGSGIPDRIGLIHEWETLNNEVKSFVAEIEGFTLDQFVELKMGEELANLEVNYATRLTGLEQKDNNLTAQLAQTVSNKRVAVGNVRLPSDFPKIPFPITKRGEFDFTHGFEPNVVHDWSNATEVFIGNIATYQSIGDTKENAISIEQFIIRYKEGLFDDKKDFILSFVDDLYRQTFNQSDNDFNQINVNVYFRSVHESGRTIIGRIRPENDIVSGWTLNNGVYEIKLVSGSSVDYPVNLKVKDGFGIPRVYEQVSTLLECQETKGSFFLGSDNNIFLNKFDEENINDVTVLRRLPIARINQGIGKVIFENLDFTAESYKFNGNSLDSQFYFSNCTFYRGNLNAFAIDGVYKVYLLDCVSAYASADGFNYHTTNEDSLAVEVNCVSYSNGEFKFLGGYTLTASNNGSSAHNGMNMLRVGCKYSRCEGSVIADIENCYSISIGCEVFDILPTSSSLRAGFYVQNVEGTSVEDEKPKYFIECRQSGMYFRRMILSANSTKTYYQNVLGEIDESYGLPLITDNVKEIRWESIS